MRSGRRYSVRIIVAAVVILAAAQVVPYGRDHTNPPVRKEPPWDSPKTRELAVRACFGCHSNETQWPWYASFAPASWLVQSDVDEARADVNFSEWDRPQKEADTIVEEVESGDMPPLTYRLAHPSARLTASERRELATGLRSLFERGRDDAALSPRFRGEADTDPE